MAGKVEKAFARLAAMDAFLESADSEERQQRLAKDYRAASRKPGTKVLVISPTHREGDAVTRAIRGVLRGAGRIKTEEQETTVLQRGGLTAAQRGEASSYFPDQVVQFTQNTSGHQRGERLVVKERLPDGTVLVQQCAPSGSGMGASFELGLSDKDSFEVYTPKRIGISVGDRIRITVNGYVPVLSENEGVHDDDSNRAQPHEAKQTKSRGKKKPERRRLINNAMYIIKNLTKGGDFVLDNGWVLPRSYGHFAHGYCTTSHASQGMTVDTVLISQSAESFGASSLEQFYVSCSRGKIGNQNLHRFCCRTRSRGDSIGPTDERGGLTCIVKRRGAFDPFIRSNALREMAFSWLTARCADGNQCSSVKQQRSSSQVNRRRRVHRFSETRSVAYRGREGVSADHHGGSDATPKYRC